MKFGQTFQEQSLPQWRPYYIDYDELKHLIKTHTTRDSGQAVAIPGQADTVLSKFERIFYPELCDQHDRVGLFVRSKFDEISRRLEYYHKLVLQLLTRCANDNGRMTLKRRAKFSKYDAQIGRCGDDLESLQRFVDAQRMAFHKILKKYKKWTGSRALSGRFNDEILGNPKSFTKLDFNPLLSQRNDLLENLRASAPISSQAATPSAGPKRESFQQPPPLQTRQSYWNEYDDGSEVENEPFTILINPNAQSTFPGAKTLTHIVKYARGPVEKVIALFSPMVSPSERQPLIENEDYFPQRPTMEADDDTYASSSEFPTGYAAHYATFPSVDDQRLSQHNEKLLLYLTFASFTASMLLLIISGTLVETGKHKLRVEVDAGVIVGVVSSLFFATLGLGTMIYRKERLSWAHRISVFAFFTAVCLLNGILLVLVAGY